jgi:HEPN domain-containing protein
MAIFRADFQNLTRLRLREAKLLLKHGLYAGAYHVAGFSVECALKACIAKKVARYEFPDKQTVLQAWTHDLFDLVKTAGLKVLFDTAKQQNGVLDANWAIVAKWKPEIRYTIVIDKLEASALYSAIVARRNGVMQWIRTHW